MIILFTLFFISLVGILVMVGRKLAVIEDIHMLEQEFMHPFVPDLQRLKNLLADRAKRYGHAGVVVTLRVHIRTSNLLKSKYVSMRDKLRSLKKNKNGDSSQPAEVSKFLRMVTEYKHKIREIKHRIHEEENNL